MKKRKKLKILRKTLNKNLEILDIEFIKVIQLLKLLKNNKIKKY